MAEKLESYFDGGLGGLIGNGILAFLITFYYVKHLLSMGAVYYRKMAYKTYYYRRKAPTV